MQMLIQLIGNQLSTKQPILQQETLIELQKTLLCQNIDEKLKGGVCKNLYWVIFIQGADNDVVAAQKEILLDVLKKLMGSKDQMLGACSK